jgi:non-ribosomal peptide synthetase component F
MLVSEKGKEMMKFWEEYLSSPPDYAVVPYDYNKTDIRGKAKSLTATFSRETSQKVKEYISSNHSTFYIFMLTLYTQLMHRYTLKDDICIGITASNRTFDGAEEIIGFFANTLVYRDKCSADECFSTAMKRVKRNLNAILDHQEMPFESIVNQLAPKRDSNEMPFFKNMFTPAMRGHAFENEKLHLDVMPADDGNAKFDMLIMPGENENRDIHITVTYDTSLYSDDTMHRFLDNYGSVLEAVCRCDALYVSQLEFDDEEYETEEVDYNF